MANVITVEGNIVRITDKNGFTFMDSFSNEERREFALHLINSLSDTPERLSAINRILTDIWCNTFHHLEDGPYIRKEIDKAQNHILNAAFTQ